MSRFICIDFMNRETILVTGCSGNIGSRLVRELKGTFIWK